jgi:pyruvate dehydrogenase E2 component (dihydrolipoamide acetyltransferase)
MATKVIMAQLSPTMEEGRLVEWKVAEGDEVAASDVLAEVETDKANMDIEAMRGGTVRRLLVSEGDTVPVGAIIGILAAPDEDISELLAEAEESLKGMPSGDGAGPDAAPAPAVEEAEPGAVEAPASGAPPVREPAAVPSGKPLGEERHAGPEARSGTEAGAAVGGGPPEAGSAVAGRLRVSPVARRMAEEQGVRLEDLAGSGPGGRIVKADVERALETGAGRPAGAPPEIVPAGPVRLEDRDVPLTQMRKTIAKRLVQSIGPVPHFFLTTEIDMERALELRARLNERIAPEKVGVNDLLVKVVAEALVRHPEVNASWHDDAIRRHGSVDVGIAVAVEDGLITPVLRDADRKGLLQIGREAADLIDRGRQRRLAPEEYTGATFSVSNLGMFEIDQFTAIINPPEAAILAVGATVEKPVALDGQVVVRRRMRVTMSCDHRVIDGATGARFLATFKAMLENPLEIVL